MSNVPRKTPAVQNEKQGKDQGIQHQLSEEKKGAVAIVLECDLFLVWLLKYGFVASYGVQIDKKITLGDLEGIIDQIDAEMRGWA